MRSLFNWGAPYFSGVMFKKLLISALKFRQDHRIKKMFLPFRKKGKKHNPSSREGVQSLCQQYSKAREKAPVFGFSALFFLRKRNYIFSASSGRREKKIKSIQPAP
jgi:hypothetical protein